MRKLQILAMVGTFFLVGVAAAENAEIFPQMGHTTSIKSVAFSPDDRTIASAGIGTSVKLWDVASGRELRTLSGHTGDVNSVAFSPDGRIIASGSSDKSIKLWDVASGMELRTLKGASYTGIDSVAFSPDGRTIALGSHDIIELWDITSGRKLWTQSEAGNAKTIAFSSDGRTIASGTVYGELRLWDVASGMNLRNFKGHHGSTNVYPDVYAIAFSPDGRTIVSGSKDETSKIIDVASGKELSILWDKNVREHVRAVAFSPDGRTIISGVGRKLQIWDAASGLKLNTLSGGYTINSVAFSHDGRKIVWAGNDGHIRFWDVASNRALPTMLGYGSQVNAAALSPDGHTIASNSKGTIQLWDTAGVLAPRALSGHIGDVKAIAFSPDGRIIASSSKEDLKLWDVVSGMELRTLKFVWSNSVAFSPDGRTIIASSIKDSIKLWDVATLLKPGVKEQDEERDILKGHSNYVNALAFSPDGHTIASGSSDGFIKLWDATRGRELRTMKADFKVQTVAFSPDGRTIASGNSYNITLWDAASGRELRTIQGDSKDHFVKTVAFSPDGLTIISGKLGGSVKLWDVASGRELRTLSGHHGDVNGVVFSPNGRDVYTGGSDGTIRQWDISSGKETAKMVSFLNSEWITITPEGYYNASINGHKHMNVRMDNQVKGIDQFYDVFYRPDIVQTKLKGEDISDLISLTLDDAIKSPPPTVVFATPPQNTDLDKIKVCYKVKNTGGGIGEVRLFQNGKLVKSDGFYREAVARKSDEKMQLAALDSAAIYRELRALKMVKTDQALTVANSKGKDQAPIAAKNKGKDHTLIAAKSKGEEYEECQELETMPGENEISVSAFNSPNTIQSNMETLRFNSGRKPEEPNLYILGIGIDKYRDPSATLQFASKDAKDFQAMMQEKAGNLFKPQNIHIESLSDETATKEGILKAISGMSGKVKMWDSFILFVASHGVLLENQYYIVTSSYNGTANSANLISSNEIVEMSKKIKSLLQLYVFDTCHAGGVDSIVSGLYDARMSVMAKKMGLHIYASAGSVQEAMDGYKGNGLFTHTLLKSMQDGEKTDVNKDNQVGVIELGQRARQETVDISKTLGHPQSPYIINFGRDTPLFGVKAFDGCSYCPEMVVVPAGSFDMGGSGKFEGKPIHRVTIGQPFAIGKTEVTQGQWKAIMDNNPSNFKNCGDTCPVENVNWEEAKEFIQKLNAKSGKQYRLPSEAEWEYACRAGGKSEYCGGNNIDSVAWYGNKGQTGGNSGQATHPTATKQANAFGLYDMSGNVWEWVEDSWHDDYNSAPVDGSAWQGYGAQRVMRGGSWANEPQFVRAATRYDGEHTTRGSGSGFRLARTLQ